MQKIHPTEIIINDLDFIEKLRDIATVSNIYINESFSDNYLDINILKEYFPDVYLQKLKFDDKGLIKSNINSSELYIQYSKTNNI